MFNIMPNLLFFLKLEFFGNVMPCQNEKLEFNFPTDKNKDAM